ncbi:MAG: hypothetical protein KFF68_04195, partial [Desulfosarcina sp.]|nr:hypothetical protein [Desulfosarcina sp.]
DAILRNVLRFMRDARLCQVPHADDMGGSGPSPILEPMDGLLSVKVTIRRKYCGYAAGERRG